jgi:hypothetical protein
MPDIDFMDLDDFEDEPLKPTGKARHFHDANRIDTRSEDPGARFDCKDCRGSGKWTYSYGYRAGEVKDCFKCNGRGWFKSSQADRDSAKEKRDNKKILAAVKLADEAVAFLESRPDIHQWLQHGRKTGFEFAVSLADSLNKYGSWTSGQLAAVEKCIVKFNAAKDRKTQEQKVDQSDIDLTDVPSGVYMVPDGDTQLRVRVRHVQKGSWTGWTFVDDGAEYGSRSGYGRQDPAGKYTGKVQDQLRAITADPQEAMARYGRETGQCGVCGRPLEDPESVARGIGPVCAKKF